jgi:2-dehydro-3-deoxyglucarate aldolase/4-hydroxy-2-oxoheptanedioate aldolase
MPSPRSIKTALAAREVVRLFGLGQLASPKLAEVVAHAGGFDGFWIDAEHGGLTHRDIEVLTLAADARGLDHVVRLPATDYASIMRPLEAGAGGLIVSMICDLAHGEQAVRWAKFAPRGERGTNPANRDGGFGSADLAEYVARANERTLVGLQVETLGALDDADALAAIPDVDLLFVGPVDLSVILGVPGQFEHPKCLDAIGRVASACDRAGKTWGIAPRSPEYAARMRDMGCRLFVTGFDIGAVRAGIVAARDRYAALG